MSPTTFRLSILCAALLPCFSHAAGLGEITLHSRVGEPLRAEIPLLAGPGESFDTACFSLAPVRGADLPVVTSARTRLVRDGNGLRLILTGTKPVAEPVFMIAVQAACGIDLQRDYVLMPSAPLMLADAPEVAPPTAAVANTKRGGAKYRDVVARQGETLESIAEAQAPGSLAQQRRMLNAMKRANPGVAPEQLLAEGTIVRIPDRQQRVAAEREESIESSVGESRPTPAAPPPKPKPAKARPAVAPSADKGGDRLLLGAADEVAKPVEKRASAQGSLLEVEERMAKLENTIQQLNQEIDKMNAALTLAAQTIEAQQKLQQVQAQAAQVAPAPTPAVQTASTLANDKSDGGNWLELLLSALGGGAIAVGLASFLARRKEHTAEEEAPLAFVGGYRQEVQVRPSAVPKAADSIPPAPPTLPPAANVDTALDSTHSGFSQAQVSEVDINLNDDNSVLELAEIMLSFGRLRGAADTLALHIEESSPDNIRPWSMLLDLYRRGDMREEFDSLAAKMRPKFNVNIPAWEENVSPVSGLKSLEDYAHIVWRTSHSWGTQECLDYLFELTHDNRAGQRSGFPLEVVEEIALLIRVLEVGYGLQRPA